MMRDASEMATVLRLGDWNRGEILLDSRSNNESAAFLTPD